MSFESGESASIMANINQQQGRLKLIRDIGIDKQQRDVRMVFDLFGEETNAVFPFCGAFFLFLVIKLPIICQDRLGTTVYGCAYL